MTTAVTNTCCILAAGQGTRLGSLGDLTHKSLLPLGNKAIITHILELFGKSWNFVVALGDRGDLVRDYLAIAHADYSIRFVSVDPFTGPGSGPGFSLLQCAPELQCPFVLTACDTLILDRLPSLEKDWISVAEVENIEEWCSVRTDTTGRAMELYYKTAAPTSLAFSGLAHVRHWREFWEGFACDSRILGGELQVNNGLDALIPLDLETHPLRWVDTGTIENYRAAQRHFERNLSFEGKITDLTYRIGSRVIKFFPSEDAARTRFERGAAHPEAFVAVHERIGNYFSCSFVEGQLLSASLHGRSCRSFLDWAWINLWTPVSVSPESQRSTQRAFYLEKTQARLKNYLARQGAEREEPELTILGLRCETVASLLDKIGPEFYGEGVPTVFHGDLHGDNILVSDDGYHLIDWREGFGGQVVWGDIYYDLAKFYHTMELSVRTMERHLFRIDRTGTALTLSHDVAFADYDAAESFWQFVDEKGLDAHRIRILNALVFVNMAPLYGKEMAEYLYVLGRFNLQKEVR
jgi:hypothetical protein